MHCFLSREQYNIIDKKETLMFGTIIFDKLFMFMHPNKKKTLTSKKLLTQANNGYKNTHPIYISLVKANFIFTKCHN